MERVNIVVLASLAAALALLGLRLFTGTPAPNFTVGPAGASGLAFGPDGVRDRRLPRSRVAMYGSDPRDTDEPIPGATPGAKKQRGSRSGGAQSADLIAGIERRRDVLDLKRRRDDMKYDGPTVELPGLTAGRLGAVPGGPGGRDPNLPDAGSEPAPDVVEEPPKESGNPDVLLRIPFDGSVDPEVGGGGFQTDGLVSGDGQVEFPEDAQFSFPAGSNVNSEAGTISFEVRPQWAGADETDNSLVQIRNEHVWENSLSIVKNSGALRFIIHDSFGVESNVNIPIVDWSAGEPRQVTATWDGDGMVLYIDGALVGQTHLTNPLTFTDSTPIHIGSDFPGSAYVGAGGWISDFTVYGRALGADEVSRQ